MKTNSIRLLAILLSGIGTHLEAAEQVINPVSAFEVFVDGTFTGGLVGGVVQGEWSDVTPLAFISPNSPGGLLQSVPLSDPLRNSLLYAALAPGAAVLAPELYLMYDYLPRTVPFSVPGEFVADIKFPVTFQGTKFPNSMLSIRWVSPAVYSYVVDLNGDGSNLRGADELGIEAFVGFSPSTLADESHMLIELEVPLLIPAGFGIPGDPFPAGGSPNGVYSPDPAFWAGFEANDELDPPASAAIFTILPDGSTIAVATNGAVPEPSTIGAAALLSVGLVVKFWRRGKR